MHMLLYLCESARMDPFGPAMDHILYNGSASLDIHVQVSHVEPPWYKGFHFLRCEIKDNITGLRSLPGVTACIVLYNSTFN